MAPYLATLRSILRSAALTVLVVGCGNDITTTTGTDSPVAESSASTAPSATSVTTTSATPVTDAAPATAAPSLPERTAAPTTQAPTAAPSAATAGLEVAPTTASYSPRLGAGFYSPSGNIRCEVSDDQARCDVYENTWTLPSQPEPCDLDWGNSVAMGRNGPPTLLCHGDTPASDMELSYGQYVTVGPFTCRSESSGVSCDNNVSGHGFTVARASYEFS